MYGTHILPVKQYNHQYYHLNKLMKIVKKFVKIVLKYIYCLEKFNELPMTSNT
jgi:hypothetical protein